MADTITPVSERRLASYDEWQAAAAREDLAFIALWATETEAHALYFAELAGTVTSLATPVIDGGFPALSPLRPAAVCFERMVHDLWGHAIHDAADLGPWLDHGRWGIMHPMASHPSARAGVPEPPEFAERDSDDLHQLPLGPVHAGIAGPGHFRFTARGETIVRLERRLGYAHKGVLALIRGKSPRVAARFAARVSGDSTVAHSLSFAHAAEAALAIEPPPRAVSLRVVMAELERIANHLGDIGAVCNDAGFAFLQSRLTLLREAVLRASAAAFDHRLMMDCVIPGGVAADLSPEGANAIGRALASVAADLPDLLQIYEHRASLAERVVGIGVIDPALAARFAAGGFVGRAAGRGFDARRLYPPYQRLGLAVPVLTAGDVDARLRIRFSEIDESLRLVQLLLTDLPDGGIAVALPLASGEGCGAAESFRGDVWHWMRLEGGQISNAFVRDPSLVQWPLLDAAMQGAAVADIPICLGSFNCAYSGVDL
jgi:Ni,Fe-hydrogenase III large subunit